jgi:DnaJ-class molecular chaperone
MRNKTFAHRASCRLAMKHHPDKNPDDPKAQEKFQAVSDA